MGLIAATPIMNGGRSVTSGFLGSESRESKLVAAIITALKKENLPDVIDDDCIVHARDGDDFFTEPNFKDFVDYLKGYVIIPVEEYASLGGK